MGSLKNPSGCSKSLENVRSNRKEEIFKKLTSAPKNAFGKYWSIGSTLGFTITVIYLEVQSVL